MCVYIHVFINMNMCLHIYKFMCVVCGCVYIYMCVSII